MPLKELINQKFGVKVASEVNPVTGNVGTSVEEVLPNNPNRLSWTLVNHGSNNLYLGHDSELTTGDGIFVAPNGGSVSFNWDEEFNLVGTKLFGVSASAANDIYVISVIQV